MDFRLVIDKKYPCHEDVRIFVKVSFQQLEVNIQFYKNLKPVGFRHFSNVEVISAFVLFFMWSSDRMHRAISKLSVQTTNYLQKNPESAWLH